MKNNSEELLIKVKELVKQEGHARRNSIEDETEMMDTYVLPAIKSSKDIQKYLYVDFTSGSGSLRNLKNKLLRKIGNVAINVTERSFMKQQKFNENTSLLLEYLLEENKRLRDEVEKLREEN